MVRQARELRWRAMEAEGHTLRVNELTMTLARKFVFTDTQMLYTRWAFSGKRYRNVGLSGLFTQRGGHYGEVFYDSHVVPPAPVVARKLWDVSAQIVH